MIKVSVIVPVFNSESTLKRTLNSLSEQTLRDIEIICINDGSTDYSQRILTGFAKQDSRIKVIDQKNSGPGGARNTGIKNAHGEFVAFLDADDNADKKMIENLYRKGIDTGADIVICDAVNIDANGMKSNRYRLHKIVGKLKGACITTHKTKKSIINNAVPWNKLYRRDFLISNGLSFPEGCWFEDNLFNWKAIVLADKISIIADELIEYNVHTGKEKNYLDYFKVIEKMTSFVQANYYDEYAGVLFRRKFRELCRLCKKVSKEERRLFLAQMKACLNECIELDSMGLRDKCLFFFFKKDITLFLFFLQFIK